MRSVEPIARKFVQRMKKTLGKGGECTISANGEEVVTIKGE